MNTASNAWQNLKEHGRDMNNTTLNQLFECDADRFNRFSVCLDDFLVDYSKNLLTDETMALLAQLAIKSNLVERINEMFSGSAINISENRAALHTLLRESKPTSSSGMNIERLKQVQESLSKMTTFAEGIQSGKLTGSTGKPFNNILHIGVGGSVLGPSMAVKALAPYSKNSIAIQFVKNVDGADLHDKMSNLDPETTLILVASKTFLTQETMLNAWSARTWITKALGPKSVGNHFAALSSNLKQTEEFGILPERHFELWDWVGGRYSLWSAIGLPILISIGSKNFRQLLSGAHQLDNHFRNCSLEKNIPVILGLISIWHRSILGYKSHAIIPYDQRLELLIAHIQQLQMESNGKSINRDGSEIPTASSGVIWGEVGTNAQHSFFQLLHQGSDVIPCDFLIAANAHHDLQHHHETLIANCFAQSQALMKGRNLEETKNHLRKKGLLLADIERIAPHATFPGNRPSTTILYKKLDPKTLGMLIATYEHKTFVEGAIWNINSFDQWGVELGKELASQLLPAVKMEPGPSELDGSTSGLIDQIRGFQKVIH